jgi:AraC-like DNA-binding protein
LARLKVTTDADESMPLDQVPEDVRARVVEKKVWRLRSLFETDLRKAFEYLDDLRTHEAWKYLREPDMERLVENRCRVTPAFVEQLRSGYASLISAGHTGKVTATQAAAAAFSEDSTKTVRQVAAEVGCSVRTAHKGKVFTETDSLPEKVNTAVDESESSGLSTATIYRQRKLKADHPELWAEVEAGTKSTHAAAIAAGIVKVPTTLEAFLKLWKKASVEEREKIRIFCNTDAT